MPPGRIFLVGALLFMAVVFGIATLFDRLSTLDVRTKYDTLFALLVIAMVVWLAHRLWREPPLTPEELSCSSP